MPRRVIDLSSNNAKPNFRKLKQLGYEGVILKATEGASYNPKIDVYGKWSAEARAAGLRVGAYHFARPSGGDALLEALNFVGAVKKAGGVKRRDFRPALDLEVSELPHVVLPKWAADFNRIVKGRLGVGPLFYSYPAFIQSMKLNKPLGYGLWLASWGPNNGQVHAVHPPSPWRKVHLHQFTSKGSVAGQYPLDISEIKSLRAVLAHPIAGRP